MSVTIKFRRGTSSEWISNGSTVLASGEPGYEVDTGRLKIGDGLTAWSGLNYSTIIPTGFLAGSGISINLGSNGASATIGVSGLNSSYISDFNSAVSGLLPVKDILSGTGISVTSVSGTYTITSTGSGILADQSKSLVTTVFNKTASTIPKMSAVYINGGQGDQPTIQLAIATGDLTSAGTYGLTYEPISSMSAGKVIVFGALTGLNTDQFNPTAPTGNVNGSVVYLSPTTSGTLTTTKPHAPDHIVAIGTIVRTHQNEGVIEVRVQNGFELEELHNVAATGASNNQAIIYNSASGLWMNTTLTSSLISDFNEAVDDRIGSGLFTAGTGINLTYNDIGNSFIVSVTGLIANPTDNRVLTSRDNTTTGIDAESSLTFNPTTNTLLVGSTGSNNPGELYIYNGSGLGTSEIGIKDSNGNDRIRMYASDNEEVGIVAPLDPVYISAISSGINIFSSQDMFIDVDQGDLNVFAGQLYLNSVAVSVSGHTHTASQITDFNEAVDDRIGSGLFVAGTGINLNYNDAGNSFTVSVTGLINNPGNNRILTSSDSTTTGIDAESNLTFDGGNLIVGPSHTSSGSSSSSIVGGSSNSILSGVLGSFIGGGTTNSLGGLGYSCIVGGISNVIVSGGSVFNFIGCGSSNTIRGGDRSFIGGGSFISISGGDNAVVGGGGHAVSGSFNFVGGGSSNSTRVGSTYCTIAGGQTNIVASSGTHSSIAGGRNNTINHSGAFIGGGFNNTVSGLYSAIIAGSGNNDGGYNNVFILGSNVTGTQANTTYVQNLRSSATGNFVALQVNGTGVIASSGGNNGYLSKFTSSNTINDSIIYQSGNRIGINTSNPSGSLHVIGSGLISSVTGTVPNSLLHLYSATSGDNIFNVEGTNGSLFSVTDNLSGTLMSVNNNAGLPVFEVFSDDRIIAGRYNQNDFVINSSGNIGIGNSGNNSYKLNVVGNTNISGVLTVSGVAVSVSGHTHTASNITDFNSSVSGLIPGSGNQVVYRNASSIITGSNNFTFNEATGVAIVSDTGLSRFSTFRYGNDTTGPSLFMFKARGSGTSPAIAVTGDTIGSVQFRTLNFNLLERTSSSISSFIETASTSGAVNASSYITINTSPGGGASGVSPIERVRVTALGNVGIGATAPLARLQVSSTSSSESTPIAIIHSSGTQCPLTFRVGSTNQAYVKSDNVGNLAFGANGFIAYEAGGFGSGYEKVRIQTDGKVGIGTSSPAYTLDVNGGAQFTQVYPSVVSNGTVNGSVATDVSAGQIFDMTINGSTTLSNPTNAVDGVTIRWRIQQDGTGGHSMALDTKFQIPSSATNPLPWSTGANAMDILAATYHAGRDKWDIIAFVPGY